MMAQMSSDLHGVGINLNNTQIMIVYNTINMWIMLELPTE